MAESFTVHFIANYWRYIVGTILPLLLLFVIRSFFTRQRDTPRTNRSPSELPEEHPLAEFRDTQPSDKGNDELPTALHDENTEQIPFVHVKYTEAEMIQRSQQFYKLMNNRRSVRMFSCQQVPIEIIRNIVHTAGTSPSGEDLILHNCYVPGIN